VQPAAVGPGVQRLGEQNPSSLLEEQHGFGGLTYGQREGRGVGAQPGRLAQRVHPVGTPEAMPRHQRELPDGFRVATAGLRRGQCLAQAGRLAGRGDCAGHRHRVLEQVKDRAVLVDRRRQLLVALRAFRPAHRDLDPDRRETRPH
jgi:hypothetical protein